MVTPRSVQSNKAEYLERLLVTLDACLIAFSYLVAIHLYLQFWATTVSDYSTVFTRHMVFMLPLVAASAFSLYYFGAYRTLTTPSRTLYLLCVLRGLGGGLIVLLVTIFVLDIEYVSRMVLGIFFVLALCILLAARYFLIWWYFVRASESDINHHRVLIVGSGSRARRLRRLIARNAEWGLAVVGHLDSDPALIGKDIDGAEVIGTISSIHEVLQDNVVDEVMVAVPRNMLSSIAGIAEACDEEGVELRVMADLFEINASRIKLDLFAGVPLVSFAPVSFDESQLLLKRIFDLVLVLLTLPISLPILFFVAIAIKIDDPAGPVLFIQERVGLRKRRFDMYKFRSMVADAEARLVEIEALNEAEGPNFKITHDPRITRVGRFIRKTSLDELPQLLNVLLGHMSLVGPRPMSVRDVDRFDKALQRKRFSVTPGLTCIWQISGRSNLTFDQWLEMDLTYIDNWSLELDLRILMQTVPAVLLQRGAV